MRVWLALGLLVAAALAGCAAPGDGGGTSTSGSTAATTTGDATGTDASGTGTTTRPGPPPPPSNGTPPPAPAWAAPQEAAIRPGVQIVDGGCTMNFVFTSPDNATVYVGTAAHCVTRNDPNAAADGCDPASGPFDVGAKVQVDGASKPGTLVYTSWGTMQALGESDGDACRYNDFAVVQLDPADHAKVNPAMQVFGGPTARAEPSDMAMFTKVLTYGNSGLRGGVGTLSPHEGYVIQEPAAGDWTAEIYTVTQGIPGDSGSGVLLGDGRAMGILVTISYIGASNGVTLLGNAMEYARDKAGLELRLATWEQLSEGSLPPV